jgi:transposase
MKPQSSLKKSPLKAPAERIVKDIRRATRRHFSAEDKIRIVLVSVVRTFGTTCGVD